eukprot:m51a1_g4094 hypothetical protein (310) ;mRNA; f:71938-73119
MVRFFRTPAAVRERRRLQARALAFCSALHPRLGRDSPVPLGLDASTLPALFFDHLREHSEAAEPARATGESGDPPGGAEAAAEGQEGQGALEGPLANAGPLGPYCVALNRCMGDTVRFSKWVLTILGVWAVTIAVTMLAGHLTSRGGVVKLLGVGSPVVFCVYTVIFCSFVVLLPVAVLGISSLLLRSKPFVNGIMWVILVAATVQLVSGAVAASVWMRWDIDGSAWEKAGNSTKSDVQHYLSCCGFYNSTDRVVDPCQQSSDPRCSGCRDKLEMYSVGALGYATRVVFASAAVLLYNFRALSDAYKAL